MRRLSALISAGLVVAALSSCGDAPGGAAEPQPAPDGSVASEGGGGGSVVVTTNILGDIVTNVVGDEAEVDVLMGRNADPHSFGISAAQAASMVEADLVIANGLGLEEGLLTHLEVARDEGVPVIEIAPQVDPISFDMGAGDEAGTADPHVWTDPDRMQTAIELVEAEVAANVAGVDAEQLAANAQSYSDQLASVTEQIEADLEALPDNRRKLVTNHHVFGYFAERFDFEVVGAVLPSGTTLASPSAADLAGLAGTITDAGVPAIFADSSQPEDLANALASEAGLDVDVVSLHTESLGEEGSGAATYLDMLATNADAIVAALGI